MKRTRGLITEHSLDRTVTRRALVLGAGQAGVLGLLAVRMGWLSIAQSDHYRLLSDKNRIRLSLVRPRRGWILDRTGRPIAANTITLRVDLIPARIEDRPRLMALLQHILALPPEQIERINQELDAAKGYQPVAVADDVPYEHYATLVIREAEMPGILPSRGSNRIYPAGAAVGQLVGYVGAASADAYARDHDPLLITPGFKIGKAGLEKTLEPVLRGKPGAARTEVTAEGRPVRDLARTSDIPGRNVTLTIDADLQAYVAGRMGEQAGSVVVLDCLTGELLAMVSMPSYDPNIFSHGISTEAWAALASDERLPLVDKVLDGLYPPGSTSKPMTSLAILDAGVSPDAMINCTGSYKVGNSIFHCVKHSGHGPISLHRAIVESCDVYFYHFGQQAGIERIAAMARKLGLGAKYDLPVTSQHYGTVPDRAWKQARLGKPWSLYDTVNASIGQGYMLVNPLQLATMAARIASGQAVVPQLLKKRVVAANPLDVSPEHLAFVRAAMAGVVNAGGSGKAAKLDLPGIEMAGKTGTAQVRRISMAERGRGVIRNESLPWKLRDHSLFICFAPVGAPRYAAAVVIEHGGFGAAVAAPIARDTIRYLYKRGQGGS